MFDTTRIIRGTLWWGLMFIATAVIIRALGFAVEPRAVVCGVAYAAIGVQFYSVAIGALFGKPGELRRFVVWFPIKLIAIVGGIWLMSRSSGREILAALWGVFAFLPAGFQYAAQEGRSNSISGASQGEGADGGEGSAAPPSTPAEGG